jgi:hypothetical protein
MKVYLVVYDSESDCDGLIGVYRDKDNAIACAIELNMAVHHEDCENSDDCTCKTIIPVDHFQTKSMYWGPALNVGPFHYIVERDLN